MNWPNILPYLLPGIIYGIGAIGLAITLRYLREPDFTSIGAVINGGITCIYVTNATKLPTLGILAGCGTGIALGGCTALLRCGLRIPLVLAGIIVFTASIWLGFAVTSNSGYIPLDGVTSPVSPTFELVDFVIIGIIAAVICISAHYAMKTSLGSLTLAMTADGRYVTYRHRYAGTITFLLLCVGNGLIGLCGALLACKMSLAAVDSHRDFLSLALGAIFAGQAVTRWIFARMEELSKPSTSGTVSGNTGPGLDTERIRSSMTSLILGTRDDSSRIGLQFAVYVAGAILLSIISGIGHEFASGAVITGVKLPANFEYLVTAVSMGIFVWWAARRDD